MDHSVQKEISIAVFAFDNKPSYSTCRVPGCSLLAACTNKAGCNIRLIIRHSNPRVNLQNYHQHILLGTGIIYILPSPHESPKQSVILNVYSIWRSYSNTNATKRILNDFNQQFSFISKVQLLNTHFWTQKKREISSLISHSWPSNLPTL